MARQDDLAVLRDQVADLQKKLAVIMGDSVYVREDDLPPTARPDYIEFGSPQHAALLGLKKETPEDAEIYVINGWTLMDVATPLLASRGSKEYVRELLRQKVAALDAGAPPLPQSTDRRQPHYAPPMWTPSPADL